ncbi:AAA family ATPase [Luteimonas sp. RD2P54]|uniref:AAA family ATPase n=1 Tax=Luteimonas endophytica TaxID=3042023 RepID=A0ABT6JBX2_9GAMM|nr:AAA family ATPase [Luteimonas endophytica]MDH5824326.1 AAA family ATPase [Luteimonas endophytica]
MNAFESALGSVAASCRFFVYLLTWNAERGKYDKRPVGSPAAAGMTYPQAHAETIRLRAGGQLATVGLWLTAESGLFFLDIDALAADYTPDARAQQLLAMFPGAFVEWSSSRRGLHIVGRLVAPVLHSSRNDAMHLEFYTSERGIALNIDAEPAGSMDSAHDLGRLVTEFFPPRTVATVSGERRPEWRGPADDDELIRRMLAARVSAAVAFGGKVSPQQLWDGQAEKNSNNDAALASHLAFWTGCDSERMERLLWRSGMVRSKWRDHRTYLSMTVANACAACSTVYQQPEPPPLPAPVDINVRSGAALMQRAFAPVQWALHGLIPQGTAILSAAPKSGKSWLVLQACIAVAAGVPLWHGREPEKQGDTLYLDLEGADRRLQERIAGLLKTFPADTSLNGFFYDTEWPRAEAGVVKLREWLTEHPRARMIVIDTLASFRDPDPGRRSAYMADYAVGEMLKPLVREFPVAIVIVSHTRKMTAGDPMDKISGTQGLVGGVDNYLILSRANGNMEAELVVNGRDIKEPQELALRTLKDGGWVCVGNSYDIRRSDERNDVLKALADLGGVGTSRDIHAALDTPVKLDTLYKRLGRMVGAGEIIKAGKLYTLLSKMDHQLKTPPLPGA